MCGVTRRADLEKIPFDKIGSLAPQSCPEHRAQNPVKNI